jgi:anti-sigma B factor antagonist
MQMEVSQLGERQVKITFTGRLDTPGVDQVETRFVAALVPAGRHALIDLSAVEFIGSLGVRMLISVARSLSRKDARLVLVAPQSQAQEVFDHVSLSEIIPICPDEAAGLHALSA